MTVTTPSENEIAGFVVSAYLIASGFEGILNVTSGPIFLILCIETGIESPLFITDAGLLYNVILSLLKYGYKSGGYKAHTFYDGTFELNEFSQPRLRSEIELVKNTILYVLFTKPGQYPSLPHIGIDVNSLLYSYYDDLDENDLKRKVIDQCSALGSYIRDGTIQIKKTRYRKQPSLMIHISGQES